MYVTISPQKSGGHYAQSVRDYATYLEKENEGLPEGSQEFFFNGQDSRISWEQVVTQIDGNTAKLSQKEPRFYAITLSPSPKELSRLTHPSEQLKAYTREVMQVYATCFHREMEGRPIRPSDVLYFAKVEHKRYYKGTDAAVRQNQSIAAQILEVKHTIRRVQREAPGADVTPLKREILRLEALAPAQLGGQRIREGMEKPGPQTHIHIIVSRKDASNSVSLSPGSKYKASEVVLGGKIVKRGFDRDRFFEAAERLFDQRFGYQRGYVERYASRKLLSRQPDRYFKALMGLPASEKALALKAFAKAGVRIPVLPTTAPEVALKALKQLHKSAMRALSAGSIQI